MFFRGREAGVPNSASFCSVLRRGRRWSDGGEREEVDVEERGAIVIILLAFTSLQLSPLFLVIERMYSLYSGLRAIKSPKRKQISWGGL